VAIKSTGEYTAFELVPGRQFEYEPALRRVVYNRRRLLTSEGKSVLLHEVAHALLRHRRVRTPERQERIEAEAWALAAALAEKLGLEDVRDNIASRLTK
jgi:hypothetical protein